MRTLLVALTSLMLPLLVDYQARACSPKKFIPGGELVMATAPPDCLVFEVGEAADFGDTVELSYAVTNNCANPATLTLVCPTNSCPTVEVAPGTAEPRLHKEGTVVRWTVGQDTGEYTVGTFEPFQDDNCVGSCTAGGPPIAPAFMILLALGWLRVRRRRCAGSDS